MTTTRQRPTSITTRFRKVSQSSSSGKSSDLRLTLFIYNPTSTAFTITFTITFTTAFTITFTTAFTITFTTAFTITFRITFTITFTTAFTITFRITFTITFTTAFTITQEQYLWKTKGSGVLKITKIEICCLWSRIQIKKLQLEVEEEKNRMYG
jgi:hypothetical protein